MLILRLSLLAAPDTRSGIALEVDAREAVRGILHARLAVPVQPGALTLYYPKWIPGEHGPTGPIRDLVGLRFSAAGKDVPWQRDQMDMYSFHCQVPPGVRLLDVSLDFLVPLSTEGFTSGASTTPNLAIISWNQVLLYPKGPPADQIMVTPRLLLPQGWQFGTALEVDRISDSAIDFKPVTLTALIDSPVLAGAHMRKVPVGEGDLPHEIVLAADDEGDLDIPPDFAPSFARLVREAGALFGTRHYSHYHFLVTLSDYVSHFGLEHHQSSDDRLSANALRGDSWRRSLGGLLAHEFVHSWNGKFRRPEGLVTRDYQQPMDTDMLWVYEGLTEYLGTILPARSGLWTGQDFRAELASTAAYLDQRPGRTWRSLEDTAVSAQVLYEAGQAWSSWRRSVDFYDESTLIWLEVDVMLRDKSEGKYSLDDFCARFYGGPGGAPALKPFTFQDVTATLSELVPYDWKGFFLERLNSKSPHAPLSGLEASGWKLVFRSTPPDERRSGGAAGADRVDVRYSLGIVLREGGVIADVVPGGPGDRAGLAPQMKILAVNGRKYSGNGLREAIRAAKGNTQPIDLLVENRNLYKTYHLDYHDGERYPYLERDPTRADVLEDIIRPKAN